MPRMKDVARISSREIAPVSTADQQGRGRHRLDQLAADQQQAAVVAVGDLAHHEEQQHRGNELDQPNEAEIERVAGQRIELPGHRHDEHLVARRDREAREPEQHERPVAQDGVWCGCHLVLRPVFALRASPGSLRRFATPRTLNLQCGKGGLPAVAAKRRRLVEPGGIEPPTSSLRTRRSPS